MNDGRRLHKRYPTNTDGILKGAKSDFGSFQVRIIDVSRDSLTCQLSEKKTVDIGSGVVVEIFSQNPAVVVQGKIVSCFHSNNHTRIGISLSNHSTNPPHLLTAPVRSTTDRRTQERRLQTLEKNEKRQFDRRGVWQGLLAKRYFSHHAWELKKNDVYFYAKPIRSSVSSHVKFGDHDMIMMASNNYLGLNTHPKVVEAAIKAIKKYGTGSSGSNLVGGTYDIHIELEEALAKFMKVEAVCVCISGYVANTTTLTTILGKEDAVFNDALNHASLIDGSLRNGAYFRIFRHNDTKDLERKLANCKRSHKMVVADAVYSMDGDIAPLPEMFRLCKKYNAALMIDQAHATGVFGENGRGVLEHFGMDGKADIVVGTMSKSLAAIGGFIGGSKELINILRHSARQIFFSTNVSPSACASILAALEVMRDEPERRISLWRNTEHLRAGLQEMGFNTGTSASPIIPVIFPTEKETNLMAKALLAQDIYVTPIIYPAVKKDQTRIRLSVIATHTEEDIDKTLKAFKLAKSKIQ